MKLPPLNALRAFEAAARHRSFVKAAEEMYVSPAAVSRHVKNLEENLSLTLFDRKAQGIVLTEVGKQLLPELSDAFQRISAAAVRARTASNEIHVLVGPTFGVRWLIPRLPQFQELHPTIRINTGLCIESDVPLFEGAYDVGIIEGWWIDCVAPPTSDKRVLRYERLAPVCSPVMARQSPRLRRPSDLRGRPLLHVIDTKDWDAWLAAIGETGVPVTQCTVFHTGDAAARAAMAGKGVAIVNLDLYKHEVDSGQLVVPFEFVLDNASPVIFFCSRERLGEPAIAAFHDWLEAALRQ
jgi:LysR family glycine cleavage system transcriptional activator